MWKRGTALLTALLMLFSCALAEDVYLDEPTPEAAEETADDTLTARDDLINRIIALGQELYIKANGKSQRAHYKRDIYVCKNFTTYLFRQNRDDFCMAEYPDVQLLVPNNLSAAKSKPYSYGIEWEDISPEKGNPFYIAAQFKYDKNLSEEENMALACDFMRQAQRGDYFQMSAKYEYGTGAHSAIMLGYDPETDEIHWMDSNMRGGMQENRDLKSVPSIAMLGGHLILIVGAYAAVSGDMGSALVFVFVFACMCFVAGVAKRWFVIGILGGSFAFYVLWETDKINPYMKERFMTLFDHDLDTMGVGWQQTRSLLALGGGKLTGQGLFHGTQTQSKSAWSLPARHTDFIFSVIGEELGMLGCLFTIALLAAIILRCVLIARHAQQRIDMYICVGVAAMLIFQVISNIGMCLFVMPVIGLTLPFISYGGTSIVTLFAAMGMVSGIQKRARPEWLR